MVVGGSKSGKSTLIQTLEASLLRSMENKIAMECMKERKKMALVKKGTLRQEATSSQIDETTGINKERLDEITQTITDTDGVDVHYVYPKSCTLEQFIGFIDQESQEWRDGIFTKIL